MNLVKITIQRYRSINNLTINIKEGIPLIICGSNNVGKTNFLRALDLFFSLDKERFDKDIDIPYDIAAGRSTGGRYKTTFRAFFREGKDKYTIKVDFKWNKKIGNTIEIKGRKNKTWIVESEARSIIKTFRFIFVEASNINIPRIIDEIIDDEVLPLGLDPLRAKQKGPLKIFYSFVKSSEKSVKRIENEVDKILNEFITDIPGIKTKGWKVEILFAEYKKLREAISTLINFTLYDKNKKRMESKGSGIQRIIFLSLVRYIADHSKKKVIWGIDEPEAFLQPALQKRVQEILNKLSRKQAIFYTTHSPNLVGIDDVSNTYLFEADYTEKAYAKKKDEVFYKVNTHIKENQNDFEKIQRIKQHLGITRNDSWEIMKYNILVEGEEDKYYLTALFSKFDLDTPNILIAGGATKIRGYLQFLQEFCEDLKYKPIVRCIFDHDKEGKEAKKSLESKSYGKISLKIEFVPRFDGLQLDDYDYEIEDFIYPEIIRRATNNFLQKLNYNVIKLSVFQNRFKSAYNKRCILDFINETCKAQNSDKSVLDMNSEGVKKTICERSLRAIKKMDLKEFNLKYPKIKEFLVNLSKSS